MTSEPATLVVGLNRTQDASICVLRGDGQAVAVQKERLTRQKHHWGAVGDVQSFYYPHIKELAQPVDLVVECYSSDPTGGDRAKYHDELRNTLSLSSSAPILDISHHLAHLYSCYFPSGFNECAAMVIDCAGSALSSIIELPLESLEAPPTAVETASFYHVVDGTIRCIKKTSWSVDWSRPAGLGAFYHLLTRRIFAGEGNEGKVMALASFGDGSRLRLPKLLVRDGQVTIPSEWIQLLTGGQDFAITRDGHSFQRAADLAAVGQECFEDALLQMGRWLRHATGSENLCFAGGTALNCPGNTKLASRAGFSRVYIPPAPHDGGTAIGCALYGQQMLHGPSACRAFSWRHDYLGISRSTDAIEGLCQGHDDVALSAPANLPAAVAELIASGAVVGLFQERSEFGPRALGNRSILADPRDPDIQRRINETIKGRELFRPLAPTVLERGADEYFELAIDSPFMQFAVGVRPGRAGQIPGVVHHDGTARIQVLRQPDNPLFFEVIAQFERLTGVPMVLNTSFNGASEPIVETVGEAFDCFVGTGMDALACPPYLVTKR